MVRSTSLAALLFALLGVCPLQAEEVVLGKADLLSGIPGSGRLTLQQIESWLDDPANHQELDLLLPIGLDAGSRDLKHLPQNRLTPAKIELGRQLFFDPRLSLDRSISCASCHDPSHGYAAPTQFGIGIHEQAGNRNSPSTLNRIFSNTQFRDGRADSLEEQAVGPIANPIEMGLPHDICIERLSAIPGYRVQFEHLFEAGLTIDNVAKAIASFERTLVTGPTAWDLSQRLEALEFVTEGEELTPEEVAELAYLRQAVAANPLTTSAARGAKLFFSEKAGCSQCHVGANFTDEQYHNLGVGMEQVDDPDTQSIDKSIDWGRFSVTQQDTDRGAFKTPSLRNVAQTAPYMHDGSQQTLREVIEWYIQGGEPNAWLSEKITPLDLNDQEIDDLVEFLKSLTGPMPRVEHGRLPQ